MGKNMFTKAKELIVLLKREHGENISFDTLKLGIMRYIGADEQRCVKPYIKFMIDSQLISPTKDGITLQ